MRRPQLFAATALSTVAFVPATAFAQQAYDWSGFYAGFSMGVVNAGGSVVQTYPAAGAAPAVTGYGFSNGALTLNGAIQDGGPLPALFSLSKLGAVVGADAGYNFQSGNFVYGIEADYGALNAGASSASGKTTSGLTTVTADASLTSLMSIRPRFGVAVDRLLFFATAGLAAGQTSLNTGLNYQDTGKSAKASGSGSGLQTGYVVGGGVEFAANDNVTLRAEALYYNLGGFGVTATGTGTSISGAQTLQPYSSTYNANGVIVRTGINFKF